MARQDEVVEDAILLLMEQKAIWDKSDGPSIWRRLFVETIFKCPSIGRHVWTVDGFDECSDLEVLFTRKLLLLFPENLRLFATSRDIDEVSRGPIPIGLRVSTHALAETDTLDDLRLFVSSKLKLLNRLESVEDRNAMRDKILHKA